MKQLLSFLALSSLLLTSCSTAPGDSSKDLEATNGLADTTLSSTPSSEQDPSPEEEEAVPAEPQEEADIVFDGCGTPEAYEDQPWYSDFDATISSTWLLTLDEAAVSAALTNKNSSSPSATAEGVQEKAGYITPDKIREMCYAPDLNMVIFITDVYSYKVSLYRYDIRANSLEEAMNLNEEEIFGFFSEFGPRVGNVIKLTASYGDAGHTFEEFVEYDYEANTYITKSTCHTWYEYEVDGSDGEEMKECKEL